LLGLPQPLLDALGTVVIYRQEHPATRALHLGSILAKPSPLVALRVALVSSGDASGLDLGSLSVAALFIL
jgi:hypothetical protein